jgi:hypothetical protein
MKADESRISEPKKRLKDVLGKIVSEAEEKHPSRGRG